MLTPHRHHALAGGQSQTQGHVGLAGAAGAYGDDVFTAPYVFATCQFHHQRLVHRRDGREVSRLLHMEGDDWREMIGGNSQAADLIMRQNGLFRARKLVSAETGG